MANAVNEHVAQAGSELDHGLTPEVMARLRELDMAPAPPVPEHPRAVEIRRQVEHYFSDENLATDEHLKALMGGSQNFPVSIGQILGWKRMRQYKPKSQVIQALRSCSTVTVIDNKRIQRNTPYIAAEVAEEDSGIATIPLAKPDKVESEGFIKKGYELRNGVVTLIYPKKAANVTGFEDNFNEGPLRPEVQAEEDEMYGHNVPIDDRIQTALYRFVSKRKFEPLMGQMFDKFMRFGGINISTPNWTGDKADIKDFDALDQARQLGQHLVPEDANDPTKYGVDFLGVLQCYLSSSAIHGLNNDQFPVACKVLVNFYNYLLYHKVCAEYTHDILAARDLATVVPVHDFPRNQLANRELPGDFNRACSFLFGGYEQQLSTALFEKPDTDDAWEQDAYYETERAQLTVLHAIMALGSRKLQELLEFQPKTWHENVRSIEVIKTGLEVTAIHPSSLETKEIFQMMSGPKFSPENIGTVTFQHWTTDLFTYYDLPKGARPANASLPSELSLWIEDKVQAHLEIGTKMDVDLRLLEFSNGEQVWVLDRLHTVYCPFYRSMLNELMPSGKIKSVRWRVPVPEYMKKQFPELEYSEAVSNMV